MTDQKQYKNQFFDAEASCFSSGFLFFSDSRFYRQVHKNHSLSFSPAFFRGMRMCVIYHQLATNVTKKNYGWLWNLWNIEHFLCQ